MLKTIERAHLRSFSGLVWLWADESVDEFCLDTQKPFKLIRPIRIKTVSAQVVSHSFRIIYSVWLEVFVLVHTQYSKDRLNYISPFRQTFNQSCKTI